jgi:hypothetical protein
MVMPAATAGIIYSVKFVISVSSDLNNKTLYKALVRAEVCTSFLAGAIANV